MIKRGELNSRMRDFFDVWVLARSFGFDGTGLAEAIRTTFSRRETPIENDPVCFSATFAAMPTKASQWKAFTKRDRVATAPGTFVEVVGSVRGFLQPVVDAMVRGDAFDRSWAPGGPWTT